MANENRISSSRFLVLCMEEIETLMFINSLPDIFPECLKFLREKMGWTQLTLALEIGVSESTIGNWESLKKEISPDKKNLVRICVAMKLKYEVAIAFIKKSNWRIQLTYPNLDCDLYTIIKYYCNESIETVNARIDEASQKYPKM